MNATRPRSSRLRVARWLLALALFVSTMAIGARNAVVLEGVTALLVPAAVLAWWRAEPLRARRSATLVLWTGVALTAWTALSILPLPAAWLSLLSPHSADIWARCLTPLGRAGPAWATLSVDPVATRVEVLRGVAYTVAFVAASRIAARRDGVLFLERALAVTALALAIAALVHPALGAEKVFGLYTPRRAASARHVAPIMNPNVLAGYLNIGLSILLGQLLAPRSVWPRSLLTALALGLVGTQVWVASRGGMLGTVVAVVMVAWMSRSTAPDRPGLVRTFFVPGLLMLGGVGMAVIASSEEAMGELATADISKLDLSRQAFRLVPAFPIFGVGRGAFESVFPAFRSDTGHIVYSHPENIVAQWMTEWGVVPALLAFGVLLVALRPSAALARSPRAAGAWTAIVCVAVQNLVDFGSEFPAVVLALTTCAAIVTGGTSGEGEPRLLDGWARRPSLVVATSLVAAAASAVLMLPTMHHELFDDRAALHASALDPSLGRVEFERRAEAAMLRHPAEPYLPFTGALHAVRAADGSLLPWIERTLDRAVVYGPAHLLLARWLTPRSPGQARLEYRLALEQAPEFLQYVQAAAPGLVRGYDDATELIPHGPHSAYFAEYLASAVANRLPATARRLDDLVERKDPDNLEFAARRANEAFGDVISSDLTPWCQGDQRAVCLRDALERTSRLIRLSSARCAGHSMHARLLLESGEPQRALRELRTAAETVTDRTWCYEELADLALFARSDEVVNQALERVGHAGCADDTECVRNLRFVASRERARGNERLAFAALQRARTKAPEDDGLLEEVAALAAKVDLHAEALRGYQTLAVRHPGDARWPAAVAAENLAIVKGSIRP